MSTLLNARQVRDMLGLRHTNTVYSLARSGKLPRVVISARAIRFRPEDVEAFICERTEGRVPAPA